MTTRVPTRSSPITASTRRRSTIAGCGLRSSTHPRRLYQGSLKTRSRKGWTRKDGGAVPCQRRDRASRVGTLRTD
jgi:hypothetical protein